MTEYKQRWSESQSDLQQHLKIAKKVIQTVLCMLHNLSLSKVYSLLGVNQTKMSNYLCFLKFFFRV